MNLRFVASLLMLGLTATTACGGDDDGTGGNGGSGGVDAAGGGGSGPTGDGGGGDGPTGSGGSGGGGSGPTGDGGGGSGPTGDGGGGSGPTGDGGSGGGGSGPTGDGGSGGGGSGPTGDGGSGDGGSGPTGDGGSSDGGSGPTGDGGSGDGGSSGGALLADGSPCTADAECEGGFCKGEAEHGYPSGYCSARCDLGTGECPGGGVCIPVDEEFGECFDACTTNAECRDGYTCRLLASDDGISGIRACDAACTSDAQCPTTGECNRGIGTCQGQETNCTDGEDDDHDGLTDCADDNCAAACKAILEAVCASPQTELTGDTTEGTDLFSAGTCDAGGGREVVHVFTPPAGQSGTLTVVLESATDQGLYIRTDCADAESEIKCVDDVGGGQNEIVEVGVNAGQSLPIFVDAYQPGEEGPYRLYFEFTRAVCGDGLITLPEKCDDGNTQSNDGCSAECEPEIEPYCANAPELALGVTEGNTQGKTKLFNGTCNGQNTHEDIYRFTPTANGTLRLELSSSGASVDHVLYAQKICGDRSSQIRCVDAPATNTNEVLNLSVTQGEPVFIFVDGYNRPENSGPYTLTATFTAAD